MAASPHGVITVPVNRRISQLALLPSKFIKSKRGQTAFVSSAVCWVQSITNKRPNLKLTIEGKSFEGLIDMGADVTIIKGEDGPSTWPLAEMLTHLQYIRYANNPKQSTKLLT